MDHRSVIGFRLIAIALVATYVALIVGYYGVPYGGTFNRDSAGSVADWTTGFVTAGTLLYGVRRVTADAELSRHGEAQSIYPEMSIRRQDSALAGDRVTVAVRLIHAGAHPIRLRMFTLRAGLQQTESISGLIVGPGATDELSLEVTCPAAEFDASELKIDIEWTDVWGKDRSWDESAFARE